MAIGFTMKRAFLIIYFFLSVNKFSTRYLVQIKKMTRELFCGNLDLFDVLMSFIFLSNEGKRECLRNNDFAVIQLKIFVEA